MDVVNAEQVRMPYAHCARFYNINGCLPAAVMHYCSHQGADG
jgi:hypothetical protein